MGDKPQSYVDLARQTANLRLDNENANPTAANKTTTTTTHDNVLATKTVDESPGTELEVRAADSVEQRQDMAIGNIGADRVAAGEETIDIGIQNDTPRLETYISLHNEVCSSLEMQAFVVRGCLLTHLSDDPIQIRPHLTRNRAARTLQQSLPYRSHSP